MRLTYLLPSPMHVTALGENEMHRRAAMLDRWSDPDTSVTVLAPDRGPASVESAIEEYLGIPGMADALLDVDPAANDAVVLGCFGDPGIDGLRELTSLPVVGPAAASMALAATLGRRFSVVTITSGVRPLLRRIAWENGLLDALGEVGSVELGVLELNADHDAAHGVLQAECERLLAETDTDVIVLGCMSSGFLGSAERLTEDLGVPVVNPVRAALHLATGLARMGLTHSDRAHPPRGTPADGTGRLRMHRADGARAVTV